MSKRYEKPWCVGDVRLIKNLDEPEWSEIDILDIHSEKVMCIKVKSQSVIRDILKCVNGYDLLEKRITELASELTVLLLENHDLKQDVNNFKIHIKYDRFQPCGHKGCLQHISHPCEDCGRTGGDGIIYY